MSQSEESTEVKLVELGGHSVSLPSHFLLTSPWGSGCCSFRSEGGTWAGQAQLAAYGVGPSQFMLWPLAVPQGCWHRTSPHTNPIRIACTAVYGGSASSGAEFPPAPRQLMLLAPFLCHYLSLAQAGRGGAPQLCALAEDLLLFQYLFMGC